VTYLESSLEEQQKRLQEMISALAAEVGASAEMRTERDTLRAQVSELETEVASLKSQDSAMAKVAGAES